MDEIKNKDSQIKAQFTVQRDSGFCLDVDAVIPAQGITAIFGASGSGKTTLLRCIAGLEASASGRLSVKGQLWQTDTSFLPTYQRPVGYVFQEASLFPHLTAQGNLEFAIKRAAKKPSRDVYQKVLSVMGIETLLTQYPAQLSGGEQQRVAIARALLIQPELLLMDEPLASLDYARKQEILPYLEKLHTSFDLPILYVSHSMDEVARLADHVLVMDKGKVIAEGGVNTAFSQVNLPSEFQADTGVVLAGTVIERDERWHLAKVQFNGGQLWLRDGGDVLGSHVRVRVLARDVSIANVEPSESSILNKLQASVVEVTCGDDPSIGLVTLSVGNEQIISRLTQRSIAQLHLSAGSAVWVQIKSVAVVR